MERSAVGRKNRLELGQGIGEDGETQQLSEPNAGQASQNPEAATEESKPDGSSQGGSHRRGETPEVTAPTLEPIGESDEDGDGESAAA